MHSVFTDISLILGIAIGMAFLIRLLKQPLIISYLLTGIVCGPLFFNLINSSQSYFDLFAELGVILLLFLVGLELNFNYLKKIGKVAAVTGVGQVIFTSIVGYFIFLALGFSAWSSIFLAISITFSSTIIIIKLLSDKKDTRSVYGRYTIGLMLVQDIIAISIMILLPAFQLSSSLVLSIGLIILKSAILLLFVYFITKVILPMMLNKAAESGEFLLIFTITWCFTVAGLANWVGLSLEIGAIIAGLSLAASDYQTEISSRIRPLRDFFIVLFFIILGSEMTTGGAQAVFWPSLFVSLFILIGNPFILYVLYRLMKFTRRNSFLSGLTAAQVSEFGFVFLFISQDMGFVGQEELSVFTIVALITIFISSYLITHNDWIFRKLEPLFNLFGKDKRVDFKDSIETFDVLVCGYHRLGWKICEGLKKMNIPFAVIDFNPEAIKKLKQRNIPHFFGDATEAEFLCDLQLDKVKLVISTFADADDQLNLLKQLRKVNKKALFIGNLSHTKFLDELYDLGADYVIIPHLIGGQWISQVLEKEKWCKDTFRKLRSQQKENLKWHFLKSKKV